MSNSAPRPIASPRASIHRISHSTTSTSSLNTSTSFYSAQEQTNSNRSSQALAQITQLERKGTWSSIGASTIRGSVREPSMISIASYYSSPEHNYPVEQPPVDLASPVTFSDPNVIRKPSAGSMQSDFEFSPYPADLYSSPATIQSTSHQQNENVETPTSQNVSNSSPQTMGSGSNYSPFQILSHQDYDETPSTSRVRDFNAIPLNSNTSNDDNSSFVFNPSREKLTAVATPKTGSRHNLPLKASDFSYNNEVFDTSYESSTKNKSFNRTHSSPLLPPSVKHSRAPLLIPQETFPSIFGDNNETVTASGAFRVHPDNTSDTSGLHQSNVSLPDTQKPPQNEYLPYIVHPARPSMPHIYRKRDVDADIDNEEVSSDQVEPASPLATHIPSHRPARNQDSKRGSNLAMVPVYLSPSIESLSRFPYRNSQMPEKVVETFKPLPKGLGTSANTTKQFNNKNDGKYRSPSDSTSRFDPSKVVRFESSNPPLATVPVQREFKPSSLHGQNNFSYRSNARDEGMKSPPLPNLFTTRSASRHIPVSAGILPPVAQRNKVTGKSLRNKSSISSMSSLMNASSHKPRTMSDQPVRMHTSTTLESESHSETSSSAYADAVSGPDPLPAGLIQADGTSMILPASLSGILPRAGPVAPKISGKLDLLNPNSPAKNEIKSERQGQENDFVSRVTRSAQEHHSIAADDVALDATARAAQAITDEDWQANPTNSHRLMNEKMRSYDDNGSPVCNPTAEGFMLIAFVIFPPLWLLMGAGFFDGLFGTVSTRTKLIAYILSAAFFILAIAGLVIGLVVGTS